MKTEFEHSVAPEATPDLQSVLLGRVRRLILWVLVLGLLGVIIELFLSGHTEDWLQTAPLMVILLCAAVLLWHAAAPGAQSIRALRLAMLVLTLTGAVGLGVHWNSKMEFKRESDPSLSGFRLFREAMKSKSPPALAPGALIQLGLLGLIYTYRHPALRSANRSPRS